MFLLSLVVVISACDGDQTSPEPDSGPAEDADAGPGSRRDAGLGRDAAGVADRAACESLYAAALAERTGCGCDTGFGSGMGCEVPPSLPMNPTGCRDDETPNVCARRIYDDAPTAAPFRVGATGSHTARYLPTCVDGTDGPCAGDEVRCVDGTRPTIFAQRGHDASHGPSASTTWVFTMGGEGGPCGGSVSESNPIDCWQSYIGGGDAPFRQSLTSKFAFDPPPPALRHQGGIQGDTVTFNGRPNPFHAYHRVRFERCSDWASDGTRTIDPEGAGVADHAGVTTLHQHGHRIARTLFRFLTTAAGRDLGDGSGGPPDGDAADDEDLPSLADAETILLTGSSDAAHWLIFGVDRLTTALATIAPRAEVYVVFDGILVPLLENEYRHQYPYDAARDTNANGENDIYDHITLNPDARLVPHAMPDGSPYSTAVYEEGGLRRLLLDVLAVPLDESCLATHAADPSLCYEAGHTALNHVSTPWFFLEDQTDGVARSSIWGNVMMVPWMNVPLRQRQRTQGADAVRFAATLAGGGDATIGGYTPGVWMPDRGRHTHLLDDARVQERMHLCDTTGAPVASRDLVTALDEWLTGVRTIDAIDGYSRVGGDTWSDAMCR